MKRFTSVLQHLAKRLRTKSGRAVLLVVCAAVLLIGSRGWIRNSAVPAMVKAHVHKQLDARAQSEYQKLGNPLEYFGVPHVKADPITCTPEFSKFSETVYCYASYSSTDKDHYVRLSSADIAQFPQKAHNFLEKLKAAGYAPETSDFATALTSTPDQIIHAISTGSWEAAYYKNTDGIGCMVDINVDSAPTPYLYGGFNCYKQVNFFGGFWE